MQIKNCVFIVTGGGSGSASRGGPRPGAAGARSSYVDIGSCRAAGKRRRELGGNLRVGRMRVTSEAAAKPQSQGAHGSVAAHPGQLCRHRIGMKTIGKDGPHPLDQLPQGRSRST